MSNLYRYLLPNGGGGWLRRYYQHKKLLLSMEILSSDATPMLPLPIFDFTRPIDMADAAKITSTTVDGWIVSDDGVIDGSSTSNAVLIRTSQCWQNHMRSTNQRIKTPSSLSNSKIHQQQLKGKSTENLQERNLDNGNEQRVNDEEEGDDSVHLLSRPYIRWYGHLNTTIGLESKVQRSGFCAIRSPKFPFNGASLQGLYSFLEIQCRYIPVAKKPTITPQQESEKLSNTINHHNNVGDRDQATMIPSPEVQNVQQESPTRIFTLNLRVTTALNDDIYQGHLALDHPTTNIRKTPTETHGSTDDNDVTMQEQSLPPFRTFVIPFDELTLTARGREREFQRRLMGSVDIESIGFLLMDNIEGPFQFDIAQIRAVNRLESGAVYESPSQFLRTTPPSNASSMTTPEPSSDNDDTQNQKAPPLK